MKKIPAGVVDVRSELCAKCSIPCDAHTAGRINLSDPCAACPHNPPRWSIYGQCTKFGLGDAVAVLAQPIAHAIDSVAGTKIAECGGCARRRAALNKIRFGEF